MLFLYERDKDTFACGKIFYRRLITLSSYVIIEGNARNEPYWDNF
jgi:hypothetical protein